MCRDAATHWTEDRSDSRSVIGDPHLGPAARQQLHAGRALVRVQNSPAGSERSELQPDLMLLVDRDDDYAFSHPEPADVLLVVEVADSSIDYDRHTGDRRVDLSMDLTTAVIAAERRRRVTGAAAASRGGVGD